MTRSWPANWQTATFARSAGRGAESIGPVPLMDNSAEGATNIVLSGVGALVFVGAGYAVLQKLRAIGDTNRSGSLTSAACGCGAGLGSA